MVRVGTRAAAMCVAVIGCLSLASCAGVQSAGSVSSAATPTPTATGLITADTGGGWELASAAGASTTGLVSQQAAIQSAEDSVRGEYLKTGAAPAVYLADFSDAGAGVNDDGTAASYSDRLVWVVQETGVPLHTGGPTSGTLYTTDSTIQWAIDAKTGAYLDARDFGKIVDIESSPTLTAG